MTLMQHSFYDITVFCYSLQAVAVLKAMKNHLLDSHKKSLVILFVSKLSKGQ